MPANQRGQHTTKPQPVWVIVTYSVGRRSHLVRIGPVGFRRGHTLGDAFLVGFGVLLLVKIFPKGNRDRRCQRLGPGRVVPSLQRCLDDRVSREELTPAGDLLQARLGERALRQVSGQRHGVQADLLLRRRSLPTNRQEGQFRNPERDRLKMRLCDHWPVPFREIAAQEG